MTFLMKEFKELSYAGEGKGMKKKSCTTKEAFMDWMRLKDVSMVAFKLTPR